MVDGDLVCWNCARPVGSSDSCGWCGVVVVELNPDAVPPAVRVLLPLARRWGIGDDIYRCRAVDGADTSTLEDLVAVVDGVDEEALYGWLSGPESYSATPSREYVAVTCLTMAADLARLRVRGRTGQP